MVRVTWEVDDGYVGKSRPQHTEVPEDDLEDCETDEERKRRIKEYVEEDFKQRISFSIIRVDP